jgi:RNA polymerase sigma-70 factor, ECF subfamily
MCETYSSKLREVSRTVTMPDAAELEPFRTALTGHCYRMLGSLTDAEDAVQETMVRAWQNLDRFEQRASLKTWLYRIATNVCLDALSDRSRRLRPMEEGDAGSPDDPLVTRPRTNWIEPIPDARALPADASPLERTMLRQSIRLAFVTALQHLPPRQRAALLLTEVLGWSASEVAECVEMTVAAVNSALQRARATLASRNLTPSGAPIPPARKDDITPQEQLVDRYVEAFHRYDVDALVSLLRADAVMSMPPYSLWLRGPEAIRGWLVGRGSICRGSRLVPIEASGGLAFAQYHAGAPGGAFLPWGIVILESEDGWIASWNTFLDTETLFPKFGLPPSLPPDGIDRPGR